MTHADREFAAFPIKEPLFSDNRGMSLRDYFAAKAMQGMLTADAQFQASPEKIAAWSYEYADSMLAARGKP